MDYEHEPNMIEVCLLDPGDAARSGALSIGLRIDGATMTQEEQIKALPEPYRQQMARYCLDGWQFQFYTARVTTFWFVFKPNYNSHTGNTLQGVLDLLRTWQPLPDAANESEQSAPLQNTCEE